ncbi:MAG: AbrB/MazE/SpoVT family DNA-binding domain-containing protein [Eubacteriales bacterium]|jgi:AbrB family looped-hinge helix DNA binding protein|nr:AbrB/MazE/SpoVT family DNA-binding domain-containing protein [Eubacteriales bacterium]
MTAPKGKHIFGTVKVGEKGQIVIPKDARDIFGIHPGDSLVVLGDEATGLAIMKHDVFLSQVASAIFHGKPVQEPEDAWPKAEETTFDDIKQRAETKAKE